MHTSQQLLGIFTRYPEPGRTKTRMIPQLGAEGAADLQEAMTGHTVLRARVWAAISGARVRVYFTGASNRKFRHWLGSELEYVEQGDGDLGARMARAVDVALHDGASSVVLIGCDCPEMESRHLDAAFAALKSHDAVLGPATDGGYYLIGMAKRHDALFDNIKWGTNAVLEETRRRAQTQELRIAELETLHDIDEPDELDHWTHHATPETRHGISVIIPALNEEACITDCVESAWPGAVEVIVADGGSTDDTRARASAAGARVIESPRGRPAQMNAAGLAARGDYLLFLHADSRLSSGYADSVKSVLARTGMEVGAFALQLDAVGRRFRIVEWGVRQRCRWFALPYGDQALFTKRTFFFRTGGYPNIPLMEDYAWVRRAGKRTRVVCLPQCVHVSARRWLRLGVLRTTLINQAVLCANALGVSHERLARWYR